MARVNELVGDLDRATSQGRLGVDAPLYRGLDSQIAEALQPGAVFQDPGFVSTSTQSSLPSELSPHVLVIQGTTQTPGAFMADTLEHEFLLPRSMTMRVVSRIDTTNGAIIYAELL